MRSVPKVLSRSSGTGMFLNLKVELTEAEMMENEVEDNLLIERLNAEILAESGVELDQLINPSKVVNLERDLVSLRKQLAATTNTEEMAEIQKTMDKKSATLIVEKRGVMRGWLKNLFVGQSVLAGMLWFTFISFSLSHSLNHSLIDQLFHSLSLSIAFMRTSIILLLINSLTLLSTFALTCTYSCQSKYQIISTK